MADGANLINSNVVYNTDRSMGTYQKALQQQQLKAQQAQKALTDDLSSVKADGIRQADIPLYNQKFTKWQDISIQASKERDPQKRLLLQSEASKSKNDLLNTVYRSKQEEKARTGIKTHYIGKDPYDDYEEGDWNKFMASEKLSIEDPNYIGDVTQFQLRPDTDTFVKDLNSVNDELLKTKGIYQNSSGKRVTSGNKSGTMYEQIKAVKPEVQAETYATYLATNRKAYKAAQALYPELATQLPKDKFIEQVAGDLALKNPIKVSDRPRYEWDYKPTKGDGESANGSIQITDQTIPIQNKNVPAKNIIRISPTAFNLGGLSGYDTLSDTNIQIPNVEGGVKLANIAWYPFSKSGVETTKNKLTGKESKRSIGGKLAQKDYVDSNDKDIEYRPMALVSYTEGEGVLKKQKDILIPVDDLPKDKKDIQKRIATLKANAPKQTQQSQPSQSKGKKAVGGYKIGQLDGGYKYTGGDPSKQENWVKQ